MNIRLHTSLPAILLTFLTPSQLSAQDGYDIPPIFNPYPACNSSRPWNVQNFGPVGIGIDLKAPGFTAVMYRPAYLTIAEGGQVEGDVTRFWSGDMLVVFSAEEARRMEVRKLNGKEYLLVELGNFPATAAPDWHCGYEIYVREK